MDERRLDEAGASGDEGASPHTHQHRQRAAHTAVDLGAAPQPDDFRFLSFDTHPAYADASGPMAAAAATARTGAAATFLDKRGFGWLLDTADDDDADAQIPLLEELDIDVTDIYYKVRCVLLPLPYFRLKLTLVRDAPDLWGPLLVVLAFALLSIYGQMSVVGWVVTLWLVGSLVIFVLARVLGGDVGYAQCLGVVGYCLIPLVVVGSGAILLSPYPYVGHALKLFGVVWAVYSAGTLLCVEELQHKRPLLLYPIFLLYVYFLSLYTGV